MKSELRKNLVTGDWVIVSEKRRLRPFDFKKFTSTTKKISPKKCFFCQPRILRRAILKLNKPDGSWFVISMANEFPALSNGTTFKEKKRGLYTFGPANGFQEVVITADHWRQMAQFSVAEMQLVIDVYQQRFLSLARNSFIKYISIFQNKGARAGASIMHSHSQIYAIPVVDSDIKETLAGAKAFYQKNKKCPYCQMIASDLKDKKRIVFENEKFVVLCPFAPKSSFEVRIYPKEHSAHFAQINQEAKRFLAEALQKTLKKIYHGLADPDYNFYIKTAPLGRSNDNYYHWHLVIMPKFSIPAGFELGAEVDLTNTSPEKAAELLRRIK